MSKDLLIQKSIMNVKTFLVSLAVVGLSVSSALAQHPPLGGGNGLSAATAYQIATPAHLADLATYVNNGNSTSGVFYIVVNDLNLSTYAAGDGWTPIGRVSGTGAGAWYPFRGKFNGNNKIVKNLTINRPTSNYQALFGYVLGATIENLGVEDCNIVGQRYVGGLVGYNENYSSISNCYATGKVSGTIEYVGGLVGVNYNNSPISNCYAIGNVSGNYAVGGLVGSNHNSSPISNCYATGNVSGTNKSVGGLVGVNEGNSSIISNCYATGKVSGTSDYVGGLVGNNYEAPISNCYATGNVNGTGDYVGGLVGNSDFYSSISNCYATGNVSGTGDYVGGLVGNNDASSIKNCVAANDSVVTTTNTTNISRIVGYNSDGTLQNNYALKTMVLKNSGGNVIITADNLNGIGGKDATISALQSLPFYTNAANWKDSAWSIDSATAVWKICNGENMYPFLRWQGISCNEPIVYTITATAGANGSITPAGAIDVEEGEDQTFTFIADTGYKIDQVLINGTNDTAAVTAGSYTFVNVTANHSISISFKSITGIAEITNDLFRLYPNPTTGKLRITNYELRNGTLSRAEVEICNLAGQVVFTSVLSPETTIDISHFPSGTYFVKLKTATEELTKKVIKE